MEKSYKVDLIQACNDVLQCINCKGQRLKLDEDRMVIHCGECNSDYNVTKDYIPIILGDELDEVVKANIAVYDCISTAYLEKKLNNPPRRLQTIFEKAQTLGNIKNRKHLDFGCGPGFVLYWSRDYNMEGYGLDVSIENLRNARSLTGSFVVCGDASRMPFRDGVFGFVSETAVVHHVSKWENVIKESVRVAAKNSCILFDSEPSVRQLGISRLARLVYAMRKPVYKLISRLSSKKAIFNQNENLDDLAEIHNQPGKGISEEIICSILESNQFVSECVYSPNGDFESKVEEVGLPRVILNLLSLRNPWDPRNGSFSILAHRALENVRTD